MKKRWMLLVVTVICFFALTACGNPQVKISGDEFEEIMEEEGFEVSEEMFLTSQLEEDWYDEVYSAFLDDDDVYAKVYYIEADNVKDAKKIYKNIRSNIKEEMKRKYKEIDIIEDLFQGEGIVEITPTNDSKKDDECMEIIWTVDKIVYIKVEENDYAKQTVKNISKLFQ